VNDQKLNLTSLPIIYVDTSAYLSLLLGEKMGPKIEKVISNCGLCSSSFLVLEVERNLVRLSRERLISEKLFLKLLLRFKADREAFIFKDLQLDLCSNGSFPAVKTPRSSDLVHLRTAIWFRDHEKLDGFLTLDSHQLDSAKEFRLPVITLT
jgi:hypothetical protein